MAKDDTDKLTEGKVSLAILKVSAPMTLGIFGVLSVGLADAYFLGKVGETELAAVGYIYPVITALTSLSIGLSAGANAALSQAIGRDEGAGSIRQMGLQAVGFAFVLSLIVAGLFLAGSGALFGLMDAGGDVATAIAAYVPYWAASFPFLVAMMVANAALRARGDGMRAATLMVLAAVINIALDPVFIFGLGPIPQMDTAGAGLATLIARVVAAVLALAWCWKIGVLGFCTAPLSGLGQSIRRIVKVGLPAAFSNAINPAGMAAVTAAVAMLGEAAVAGFGAATRVQSLALVPLLALSAGIGPVVGQNWAADRQDRARRALSVTFLYCLCYGALLAGVFWAFATPLAGLVATEGAATEFAAQYLNVVGVSLFGYGILVTGNAAMNARSKAVYSMSLSLARIFAVYLPAAWLGVTLFGYPGILGAAVLANVLAAGGAIWAGWRTGLLPGLARIRKNGLPEIAA